MVDALETIFLLDLPSCIVPKETEEGEAAEADNQLYDYLTKGKGRNRKVATIGVQTIPTLRKTRSTEPVKYEFRDNSTFASNWEMYDTYNVIDVDELADKGDGYVELIIKEVEVIEDDAHKLNDEIHPSEVRKSKEERELEKLMNNQNYFNAALVIERLLANNCYNSEQKKFKGLLDEDESLDATPKYHYKLDLLWTFCNEDTRNRCVTGISFNTYTEDILAVGYGKYYFVDRKSTGVVMIWNIKNPKQPERQYYFRYSVTSLAFAKKNPNYLAVGFYNGDVKVVDVSKRDLELVGEDCSSSFEPAWDVLWLEQDKEEYFLVCFGDGRVCKYHFTEDVVLERVQIMRTDKVEGKLKGLKALRMFEGNQVSSSRHSSALCLSLHSANPSIYFIGTNEGVIHRCTPHYCTQHIDMFKAHEGSIHTIKFSPFVNKVFATCGDDFQECLWVEGIDEPLIVSRYCTEPVLDFEWSPSHSTIAVSLRGMDIFLWDLQRKIYSPQSQTKSPTNSRNTLCRFTSCGRCLLVGDVDGNIHIFAVSGLPMPAFFQENLFFQSVKNILLTNTELVKKVEKLGSLSFGQKRSR
ncbi:dynein axonemal intermediate chain 4-like isoform X2 [Tenebrio molitor]|uniref:dynein axonemal intermediate chain 4-like isoform X2 n=1 Tax=Tenebrio molitor TaxID=7067 RepID=UPI0036247EBD